jgi:thymidylate synthase (FAD)
MSNGYVELQRVMGGDLDIVNDARISYNRISTHLSQRDIGVLRYLMEHKHGSPFEHTVFKFKIRCTIKEAREWFRHRWSSFNEVSSRYSPRLADTYTPEAWALRRQEGRPGAYVMKPIIDAEDQGAIWNAFSEMYADAERHYQTLLALGCAQELASFAYPLGQMTEFVWTVNARSLCNFLSLRTHETAFLELRRKADRVLQLAEPHLPVTLDLWQRFRRPDMVTDWHDDDVLWLPEDLR